MPIRAFFFVWITSNGTIAMEINGWLPMLSTVVSFDWTVFTFVLGEFPSYRTKHFLGPSRLTITILRRQYRYLSFQESRNKHRHQHTAQSMIVLHYLRMFGDCCNWLHPSRLDHNLFQLWIESWKYPVLHFRAASSQPSRQLPQIFWMTWLLLWNEWISISRRRRRCYSLGRSVGKCRHQYYNTLPSYLCCASTWLSKWCFCRKWFFRLTTCTTHCTGFGAPLQDCSLAMMGSRPKSDPQIFEGLPKNVSCRSGVS